jgi:uncharacterized membrane protein
MSKLSILIAIEIVLQIIGNFITIGPVSINLSLLPIIIAAMVLGPWGGFFVGLANGILVILAPSTLAIFMPINPLGTILICLLKAALPGLIAGFMFKLFKNHNLGFLGAILIGILVPLLNTSIFVLGCFLFFYSWLVGMGGDTLANVWSILIFGVIGWNFVFEITSSAVISPIISKIKIIFDK